MRTLNKNKTPFAYALWLREDVTFDEYGNENGVEQVYDAPVMTSGNISSAAGMATSQPFGINIEYDKIIVVDDLPVDEHSVMWVDNLDTTQPYDYVVKKVAKSLNHVSIAISKVKVS